ncbi:MAG: MoaD/ThiS family protein [Marmoricola sp.]|nr:MoaD/ThiS family protein [Marmoricola sp.]
MHNVPVVGHITLRYWASARSATGVAEEQVSATGPVDLATVIEAAVARHGGSKRLAEVLASCSVLLGDSPVGTSDRASVQVAPGQTLEFLPPFAGG